MKQQVCEQCRDVLDAFRVDTVKGASRSISVTIAPMWVMQCGAGCTRTFIDPNYAKVFARTVMSNVPVARLHRSLLNGWRTRCWQCRLRLTGAATRMGTLTRPPMMLDLPAPGNERVALSIDGPIVQCARCSLEQVYDKDQALFDAIVDAYGAARP